MLESPSEGRLEIERQFVATFPEAMELAEQFSKKRIRWYERFLVRRKGFMIPEVGIRLFVRQLLAASPSVNGDAAIRRILDWVEQAAAVYGSDALHLVHASATEIIRSDKVERVYPMTGEAVRMEMVEAAETTIEIADFFDRWDGGHYGDVAKSYRERVEAYRRVASGDDGKP